MVSRHLREWQSPGEGGGAGPRSPRYRIHLKMPHVSHTMRRGNICRVVGMSWPQSRLPHLQPLLGVGEFQATPRVKGHLDLVIHLFYNWKAP